MHVNEIGIWIVLSIKVNIIVYTYAVLVPKII